MKEKKDYSLVIIGVVMLVIGYGGLTNGIDVRDRPLAVLAFIAIGAVLVFMQFNSKNKDDNK
jgi:hypothetical protein